MGFGELFERLNRQFGESNVDEREMYINDMGRDY